MTPQSAMMVDVAERPVDELPSYLDLNDDRRAPAEPPRYTARDVAARVGAWVGDLVDGDGSMAPPSRFESDEGAKDDLIVVHRVLGNPVALVAAFDKRWGAGPSQMRAALGTLRLGPDEGGSWPRTLRGHLHLRMSFVPVPVELEIVPWHTYGLVLTLRPVRHLMARIGWHRRWTWFGASHRILDNVRRELEAESRR